MNATRAAALLKMTRHLRAGDPPFTIMFIGEPVTVTRLDDGALQVEPLDPNCQPPARDEKPWGPPLWKELHQGALVCVNPEQRAELVAKITAGVQCGQCAAHWKELLAKISPRLDDLHQFFAWTVEAHNAVSLRIGSATMTVEAAREFWQASLG